MSHIRTTLILLMLAALIFASASLLTSTRDFFIGSGVVVACALGCGAITWIENNR
jgi:hypothetical protein